MTTLVRAAVVGLIGAVAVVAIPVAFSGPVARWLEICLVPGIFIAIYFEEFAGVPLSDWRGDFTDEGEFIGLAASIAFWLVVFTAASFAVMRLLRKRRIAANHNR